MVLLRAGCAGDEQAPLQRAAGALSEAVGSGRGEEGKARDWASADGARDAEGH